MTYPNGTVVAMSNPLRVGEVTEYLPRHWLLGKAYRVRWYATDTDGLVKASKVSRVAPAGGDWKTEG